MEELFIQTQEKMKVRLSYDYGDGPIRLEGYVVESGTSVYSVTGNPTFIPTEGSTIDIVTEGTLNYTYRSMVPDLNNKVYYLFTNNPRPTLEEIRDQGTQVSMILDGGEYKGDFVYSNPDEYTNLFIALDMTNSLDIGDTATFSMLAETAMVIDTEMSAGGGNFSLSYITDAGGVTIALEQNGEIVASTGEMGTGTSGTLEIIKYTKTNEDIRVVINAATSDVEITITNNVVALTPYYIDEDEGDLSNVCGQAADRLIYFSGFGSAPAQGDIIYTDNSGTNEYDGGNALHVISATVMGAPSTTSAYIGVDSIGRVISSGNCTCSEVAVPTITQGDIRLKTNQQIRILFEASNNANSWSVNSTCVNYTLLGGERGAIFTYTDCKGDSQRVTISVEQSLEICASATPTLITGSGTYTTGDVCINSLLPRGLTFANGVLNGAPADSGEYELEVVATNCFGDSAPVTVLITVDANITLKPLLIDTTNYKDANTDTCLISGTYDMLYHNGRGLFPEVNDMVFYDYNGFKPFRGGDYWYNLDGAPNVLKIDSNGIVIESYTC